MPIVKDTRAAMLRIEAERAVQQGRSIYAPMLNTTISTSVNQELPGSVSGWADMIEAIEDAGWRLGHWTVALDFQGRPQAYPLFRRRD
jgi:hypothetical protein